MALVDRLLDRPARAPRWLPSVDDGRSGPWMRAAIGAVFLAGVAGCVVRGADRPADPVLESTLAEITDQVSTLARAEQFGAVTVVVVLPDGTEVTLCLLDGDVSGEREQGLMGVTDFADVDGMLFRWPEDVAASFVMKDTPTPLLISWWSADGGLVSSTAMTPCLDAPDGSCPLYDAEGPYRFAVEVPSGATTVPAPPAFVVPGARLQVGSSCVA